MLAFRRFLLVVLNTLTVLALGIAIFVAALWVRSHLVGDKISYLAPTPGVRALTNSGSLLVDIITEDTSVFGRWYYHYSRSQFMRTSVSAFCGDDVDDNALCVAK